MMTLILTLLLFLFPLAYSPGPGNLFFAANGARFGLRATLPANLGYHLATWAVTFAIGLGALTALDGAPGLFRAVQIAGAAYVLWLAFRFWQAGRLDHQQEARPATALDGALLLLLNPKAYVIIALMFSQFLTSDEATPGHVLLITTLFTLNNLVAFVIWTLAGDMLARRFRNADEARVMNRLFGVALGAVGLWMLLM